MPIPELDAVNRADLAHRRARANGWLCSVENFAGCFIGSVFKRGLTSRHPHSAAWRRAVCDVQRRRRYAAYYGAWRGGAPIDSASGAVVESVGEAADHAEAFEPAKDVGDTGLQLGGQLVGEVFTEPVDMAS